MICFTHESLSYLVLLVNGGVILNWGIFVVEIAIKRRQNYIIYIQ